MNPRSPATGALFVLIAAALWGTLGLFVHRLQERGFTPLEIVALRAAATVLWLGGVLAVRAPSALAAPRWAWPSFLGTGVLSMALFNWAYFQAIDLVSLSIAATLLYTGPAFVVLLGRLFFKEPITGRKAIALGLSTVGAALVSGLGSTAASIQPPPAEGAFLGLLSGFAYALYSLFAKPLAGRLKAETIVFYTFAVTFLALAVPTALWKKAALIARPDVLGILLLFGLFPTALAYLLYTEGLRRMEAGRAAMLATVEPVVAVVIGRFVFHDRLTAGQTIGAAAILLAVVLIAGAGSAERRIPPSASA
ncbi:EamA family transporter [Hydrogenibacillus sp. N12]|uniref:DMT family transporter n=1 Tax=Hydrogenibacillus sp. N12 TaxID=2866627 RepID=UPI001C7CD9F2|nr:EamA family transporter [Hydrogenibacillus sp. N12]QZA32814.1 DMT family transporter [Hydrogenibacillus sp. N12]